MSGRLPISWTLSTGLWVNTSSAVFVSGQLDLPPYCTFTHATFDTTVHYY